MTRCLAVLALTLFTASGHDVISTKLTWSREVSRIVYKHCIQCHRDGGTAASLVTYEEARPWAKAIKEEVLERRMPPWGAVKGFGDFQHDVSLSQEELEIIADWVEGGAPEGDVKYLPRIPIFENEHFGKPPGQAISGRAVLSAATVVRGVRPAASAASAQLIAIQPDGTIQTMLWLKNYNRDWDRTFVYRKPLKLPKGTVVSMDPPLPFVLITGAPKRSR